MRFDIVSVIPEVFDGPLSASMLGIARDRGLLEVHVHDLRDWTTDRHRTVDDCSFGGGPGMVMKPEPFFRAVADVRAADSRPAIVVLMCPQGRLLDQPLVEEFAAMERLILLCGRYEGVDERVRSIADLSVSVGDYIVTGGEIPAMLLVDAVSRLLPGVLGNADSPIDESLSSGLLEYPQYTRPASFEGLDVPDILRSGDHAKVAAWRRRQALLRTARLRPDLLEHADLSDDERALVTRMLAGDIEPEE
ncbi:MAG: tRNA (guanosine(37)-N1)-methyltransferase TrmD [Coriobacteriia bacterium]